MARDPLSKVPRSRRVLRGGSWSNDAPHVRCAHHIAYAPGPRYLNCGFRPVADMELDIRRVFRGGSRVFAACFVRCAYRYANDPGVHAEHYGFRPVAEAGDG